MVEHVQEIAEGEILAADPLDEQGRIVLRQDALRPGEAVKGHGHFRRRIFGPHAAEVDHRPGGKGMGRRCAEAYNFLRGGEIAAQRTPRPPFSAMSQPVHQPHRLEELEAVRLLLQLPD